ncbi:MAG: BatA domain-containing protein [Candidatus Nanohalobium sp.]
MPLGTVSNYFLNPVGLAALAALVPLITFYLIKPEPEEKVMPSMQFFMEEEEKGKIQQALRRIKKNLMLLLHLLMILLFTAAIAQLYTVGEARPEEAVIVFDASASMSDDMKAAKKFALSQAGEENTLIVSGSSLDVRLEKATKNRLKDALDSIKPKQTETDIAAAIDLAANQEGRIVVASDLDQSINSRDVESQLTSISADREIKIMKTDRSNDWGIIRVNAERGNSSVDIKNFQNRAEEITAYINENETRINVEGGEVRTLNFEPEKMNTIKLENDSLNSDNTAYISIPEDETVEVAIFSKEPSEHMKKAFELIKFTESTLYSPTRGEVPEADLYVLKDVTNQAKLDKIVENVKNGSSVILMADKEIADREIESMPVEVEPNWYNRSVEILKPVRTSIGNVRGLEAEISGGTSLSSPKTALTRSQMGEGSIIFANFEDEDFRYNFLYPVFWKSIASELSGRTDPDKVNIKTGERLNTSTGLKEVEKAGFYNSSGKTYAANLASEDESFTENVQFNGTEKIERDAKKNLQKPLTILLLVLAGIEYSFLVYTGDL